MGQMSSSRHAPTKFESALTAVSLVVIALGILSVAAALIAGMIDRFAVAEGLWPVVYGIAMYGLPAGFIMMGVAVILGQRRRRAAARDESGT